MTNPATLTDTIAADYDPIAWFYDRHWSEHYHPWALQMLERTLLSRVPPGAALLDVCCGNGVLARALGQRGYRVTGVDASERMLAYARANAPAADFLRADAREFHLPSRFEGALSTFDSLNHVLSAGELLQVFRNVHDALLDGGHLVFDLNLEERYRDFWGSTCSIFDDEHACFIRGDYDPETRIGRSEFTLFRPDGASWRRDDVRLLQRFHPAEEVIALLQRAGFHRAGCFNAVDDLGIEGHFGIARGVFFATKPSGSVEPGAAVGA